jgi:hypothetical protein
MGTALQDVRLLFHSTAILVSNRKDATLPFGKTTGKSSITSLSTSDLINYSGARSLSLGVMAFLPNFAQRDNCPREAPRNRREPE